MKHHTSQSHSKKGSILVIGMIFGLLLVASAGILLNYGSSEKTVNERHFLRLEAQAAAEAAADYGFAELEHRWLNKTNFSNTELQDDPLTIPSSVSDFFKDSHIDVSSLEVAGGNVDSGKWIYIHPNDPANFLDPQKQKRVYARDVEIYSKASAKPPVGMRNKDPVTAYCAQIFQVRDAPLFSHAIFYNMDLEFHPGPRMDILGPVHSNANIYAQSGSGLYFHSNLMAAGHIWHWYKPKNQKSGAHDGPVQIQDSDGNWKDLYKGSGSKMDTDSYYDSFMGDDWKQAAEDRWDGRVASYDHEVPILRAINMLDFVPDDPSTSANELENHAYALIEPQLQSSDPDYKGKGVQKQQFSYKAGLLLRVKEDASLPSGYDYNFYTYKKQSASDPNSERILDGSGKPVEKLLDKVNLPANLVTFNPYVGSGNGPPSSGFYDQRQMQEMDVVEIDVGLLRRTVDSKDPAFDPAAWNGTYNLTPGGQNDWNGIMYVEIPTVTSASGRVDKVKKGKSGIAIRLHNGSVVPSAPASPDNGFTLATNAPLYVLGNYNADGNPSTGTSSNPDSSSEESAALIADAITIQSNAWDPSVYDPKSRLGSATRKASFTEVSAAFMTGTAPTIDTNEYSGGVHNFPRFLENWSGVEFRYRGSMVSLFQSEVNWRPMRSNFSSWYTPPIRNWGFNSLFKIGNFPPGTPMVRDFRRRHFRHITETEYAAYTNP